MLRYMDVFLKLAFVFLVLWIVLAGLGFTTMPGTVKQAISKKRRRQGATGNKWASGFVQAPSAEDGLAFPAAPIM